mgnify:CR=1 FL=1
MWAELTNSYTVLALLTFVAMGAIGFMDDYLKVVQGRTAGLVARYKMLGTLAFGLGLGLFLLLRPISPLAPNHTMVPFFSDVALVLSPWFYVIFVGFVVSGSANAVNLTDGLDGLATGLMAIAASTFAVFAYLLGRADYSEYLRLFYLPGAGELSVLALALAMFLAFVYRNIDVPGPAGTLVYFLTLQFIEHPFRELLVGLLGLGVVSVGAFLLGHSVLSVVVGPEDNVAEILYQNRRLQRGPRIVAIGGGTGLALGFLLLEPCLNLFPAALGEEVFWVDHFEPVIAGEFFRPAVGEQDVRRLFHHGTRGADGVFHCGHAADGAGLQRAAVHNRCVEFVFALGGEDRTPAGVKHRRVLHNDDGSLDGVERTAAALEDSVSGAERLFERSMV